MLKAHPLGAYQNGPTVTVTSADVAEYRAERATRQSVVRVTAGEHLTERQLLEGILVASGNNLAHLAADWVSGSGAAFVAAMNREAQALGMRRTHFTGPSGLHSSNVSTPDDLIRLGEVTMKSPVIAAIVDMGSVRMPDTTRPIPNFNYLVGHDHINGIKTGSTVKAGGGFLFSSPVRTAGGRTLIVGAVLRQFATAGVPQLQAALNDGARLVTALRPRVAFRPVAQAGETVAEVRVPWAPPVAIRATGTLSALTWPGARIPLIRTLHLPAGQALAQGTAVGILGVQGRTIGLRLAGTLPPEPWWFRLFG